MKDMLIDLVAKLKGNKVGFGIAVTALSIYGAGEAMGLAAVEPFATIVKGVAGVLVLVAGAWVGKPKDTE